MENIVFKCSYCNKEYKRINDQHQHERWCKQNPNRQIKKSPAESEKWLEAMRNRRGKGANQFTKAKRLGLPMPEGTMKGKSSVMKGKHHTEESKKKLSESMRKMIQEGNRSYSFLHRKSYLFEGNRLDSSYELTVAKELRDHDIKFEVHPQGLIYTDNDGKSRTYFPDFYLIDYNIYLDPKNDFLLSDKYKYHGLTTKEKINRVQKENNVNVLLLDKSSLTFDKIMERINAVKLDIKSLNTMESSEIVL